MNVPSLDLNDPRCHVAAIKKMLNTVIRCARNDLERVHDPKARALFETTAEVLSGLSTAYDHFEYRSEKTWE